MAGSTRNCASDVDEPHLPTSSRSLGVDGEMSPWVRNRAVCVADDLDLADPGLPRQRDLAMPEEPAPHGYGVEVEADQPSGATRGSACRLQELSLSGHFTEASGVHGRSFVRSRSTRNGPMDPQAIYGGI